MVLGSTWLGARFVLWFEIASLALLGSFWGRFWAAPGIVLVLFRHSTHRFNPSTRQPIDPTHQPINSSIQPFNPSTHQPIDSTHQLINSSSRRFNPSTHRFSSSTHQLIECIHQPINSSTHRFNSSTHQLIDSTHHDLTSLQRINPSNHQF